MIINKKLCFIRKSKLKFYFFLKRCAEGFTEWPTCKACICNNNGSTGGCYPPCSCKFGYLGPFCDKCIDRYYGFPNCKGSIDIDYFLFQKK